MTGLHVLVENSESFPITLSLRKDASGTSDSLYLTVHPTAATIAKYVLGAAAIAYVATTSPYVFVAMALAGVYLNTKLDWLNNAVSSAWNTITHSHEQRPCYSSKFFLGVGAAVAIVLAPTIAAAYTGQCVGRLAAPCIPVIREWLGIDQPAE